jgi:hypothetical protein
MRRSYRFEPPIVFISDDVVRGLKDAEGKGVMARRGDAPLFTFGLLVFSVPTSLSQSLDPMPLVHVGVNFELQYLLGYDVNVQGRHIFQQPCFSSDVRRSLQYISNPGDSIKEPWGLLFCFLLVSS